MAGWKATVRIPLFSKEATTLLRVCACSHVTLGPLGLQPPATEEQELRQSSPQHAKEATCLSCRVPGFDGREDQVEHYKLDWHRYNIKRRLKGLETIEQDQFERIAGDLSSISGSESDSAPSEAEEEGPNYGTTGGEHTHSVYRCIVSGSHSDMELGQDLGRSLQALVEPQVWVILMRSGGHFAGAVFRGNVLTVHKTFHRYTVRAKRGTAQSVRDSQQGGHQPKSAGASLRRHNEAALMTEMRDLMTSWSKYCEEAHCIFIHTPKHNRGVLVGERGGRAPFVRGDPRLRHLPFPTRRPTLKEVQAAHTRLASIYVGVVKGEESEGERPSKNESRGRKRNDIDIDPPNNSGTAESNNTDLGGPDLRGPDLRGPDIDADTAQVTGKKTKKKKKKKPEAINPAPQVPEFVQQLLLTLADDSGSDVAGHVTTVTDILKGVGLAPISEVSPEHDKTGEILKQFNMEWNGDTVLHVASAKGRPSLVPILLLYGADPTTKNHAGHTPYLVAANKEVRDSFRRFMAEYPEGYDYVRAHVPSPLTEDMERGRGRKEAEKRREKKKSRRLRDKEREAEACQQLAKVALTDREKRAMAAERRMADQMPHSSLLTKMGVCSGCGHSLMGVVPFERLDFKYCSMDCLRKHRKQLPVT